MNRMRNETLYKLRYPLFLSLIVVFGVASALKMDLSAVGTSVFSTLAGIQSSIFAIVFSVVILGVQLSTSQYSPRLPDLFRSDEFYLRTVGIFATSIGVSILGLFLSGYTTRFWIEVWMYLSGVLTVFAFVSLFEFVDKTLQQTTPEGILDRLEKDLDPDRIVERARASSDSHREPDPFLVVSSVINSQINERDAAAVYLGLEILRRRVNELLSESSTEDIAEGSAVGESLEDLCTNRLTNTGEMAVDVELEEGANEVVNTLEEIGRCSAEESLDRPVLFTARGLSDLVVDLNYDRIDERVRQEAIESAADVLKDAAESDLWEGTGKSMRYLGWQMANSVHTRDENQNYDRGYTSVLISDFPDVLGELVDSTAGAIDDERVNWTSADPEGSVDSFSKARAIQSVYISFSEVTAAFIRFELRTDVQFPDWNNVGHGWVKAASELSGTELESLEQLWVATILYLDYLSDQSSEDVMDEFDPVLTREFSEGYILAVIEGLLSEEIEPDRWLEFRQTVDPTEIPLTGYSYTFDIEYTESFEDWLRRRRDVLERLNGGNGR